MTAEELESVRMALERRVRERERSRARLAMVAVATGALLALCGAVWLGWLSSEDRVQGATAAGHDTDAPSARIVRTRQ